MPARVYRGVNDELLMRALTGRATDEELAELEAWKAAAPEHAHRLHELQEMLADITAWYDETPAGRPPAVETLMRRADLRQAQNEPTTTA